MLDSWLNPGYAAQQITLLGTVFLACLVILPVILGALVYMVLSLLARRADYTTKD